jgi:hypothetical protein
MENVPCVLIRDVVGAASSDDASHILLQLVTDLEEIKLVMRLETSEEMVTNLLGAAASTSRICGTGERARATAAGIVHDPETGRPSLLVESEQGPLSFDLPAGALLQLAGSIARYAVERQGSPEKKLEAA